MTILDVVRERSVLCPWCLERRTWALDGVCKAKDCRARAERYKIRREDSTPSRGSHPAPGFDASPALSGGSEAALVGGEVVAPTATSCPSPPTGNAARLSPSGAEGTR